MTGGTNASELAAAELFQFAATGTGCTANGECLSGLCNNGFCCSGACSGTCQACAAVTGACVAVTNADDPDTCKGTSTCDAAGACKQKNGQSCPGGAATCASGFCADSFCCDTACAGGCDRCDVAGTAGTCSVIASGSAGTSPACGAYVCDGVAGACPATCTTDANCSAGSYCASNGKCQPQKAQAAACNTAAGADCKGADCRVCATGFCVDGVCCDTGCTGLCQACAGPLKQSVPGAGTCGNAKDGLNPHNDNCPPQSPMTCQADGKCNGLGACRQFYPAGTSCGASTCVGTVATGLLCTGSGTCANNANGVECAPAKCTNGSCMATCASTADCASNGVCIGGICEKKRGNSQPCDKNETCTSGFCTDGVCCDTACGGQCEACDALKGTCTVIAGAPHGNRPACTTGTVCNAQSAKCETPPSGITCDGDHTTKGTDGKTQDCTPYKCDNSGACRQTCTSVSDCVSPTICDPTGKCVPPDDPTGNSGGCSIGRAGQSDSGAGVAGLAMLVCMVLRRRRRQAGERRSHHRAEGHWCRPNG